SCATTDEDSSSRGARSGGGGSGGGGGNSNNNDGGNSRGRPRSNDPAFVSAKRATLVNSLSNNSLTSQTVSVQKAERQASQLPANAKDKQTLDGRISALRLARKNINVLLDAAKNLADLEMKRGGVNNQVNDDVKLELAIAAVTSQKYALAEY